MYQFFVEDHQIYETYIRIEGSDVNHIKNVLRMKLKEQIRISNRNEKYYLCEVTKITDEYIQADILEDNIASTELQEKIYLFMGLVKGEKMEFIIQKAVELGAFEIIPVEMKNSVVKLDEKKATQKTKRWQLIAESAAKQSKRAHIPNITEPMTFKNAIEYARRCDVLIVPYEAANGMKDTLETLKSVKMGNDVGVFIGPEGGFDDREIEMAKEKQMSVISLGSRILRAETAAITSLSMLMLHFEMLHIDQNFE